MTLKILPLLALILVGCVVSLGRWRYGLLICILTALVQDPIRKVTPGAPPFLTLAFVPIFLCMVMGMIVRESPFTELRQQFPRLLIPLHLLAIAIAISFCQTLTYGMQAVPSAIVGLFSYVACLLAVLLGFRFIESSFLETDRVLIFFILATSVMLLGVPLELQEYRFAEPWLGTISRKGAWLRGVSLTDPAGGQIRMISGFYRSPEIMGWHAMTLVVFSIFMMLRKRDWLPIWAFTATWGLWCVLVSGRRKMFLTILVFLFVFLLTFRQWRRSSWLMPAIAIVIFASAGLLYLIDSRYLASAESGLQAAGITALGKGILGPLELIERVGPFGFGVGTKTQGTQHLGLTIATPQFEGGFERILVELGIVGTLTAAFVFAIGFSELFNCVNKVRNSEEHQTVGALLFSIICANLASFVVTFQIFGDPFVIVLVGFLCGLLLGLPSFTSAHRFPGQAASRPSRIVRLKASRPPIQPAMNSP